jgi:predicted O-linked N-acetylglucosamine transferase (SPINDLY family)
MAQHFQNAFTAYCRGDLDQAFIEINNALSSPEAANPEVYALLGDAFVRAGGIAEAAEAFEAAAARAPNGGFSYLKRAVESLSAAGGEDRAFLLALRAQKLVPDDPDIVFALIKGFISRNEKTLIDHYKTRLLASDKRQHLLLLAELIGADNRNPLNLALFAKLVADDPNDHFTRFKLMSVAREFCDYEVIAEQETWLGQQLQAGREWVFEGETPYSNLLHIAEERLNRLATNNAAISKAPLPDATIARRSMPHSWRERIRVGYLSNDFSSVHATMQLLRNVLELHDRTRFDITLYCYTPQDLVDRDDGGRADWGRIVPIGALSNEEAANRIREDGVDILVDLKGHTGNSRSAILNLAPAPLQVGWLGFPGSIVNVDLDYVIGDPIVLPDTAKPFYHEKFARLPDSYQPNDQAHRPLPVPLTRRQLGLPEDRFVLASFNANRKISRETLDLWAHALLRIPGSILWVMVHHDIGRRNFISAMRERRIDPSRIVFADNVPYAEHIARAQGADLALDTFPYNGHTTTSDMLWAGVPVVTKRGSNFASRVSESLLNAVGVPELVAENSGAFCAIAEKIATEKNYLKALRHHLEDKRGSMPLFDPDLFCRHLEEAFLQMAHRARNDLPPVHFNVVRRLS